MCYTGICPYEQFSPITGECHCLRGKNPCPEMQEDPASVICPYCEYEIEEPTDLMNCPECNATIHL